MEHEHAASLTARVVKKALPERAILTRDARQTLNSAASMFTLYLASVAHDASVANKRQTITLKDVMQALRDVDFEHFIEPVEECLKDTKAAAALKKSKKNAAGSGELDATNDVTEQLDEVALETNEEDAEEDGMQSVEEPSEMEDEDEEHTEEKESVPDGPLTSEAAAGGTSNRPATPEPEANSTAEAMDETPA